MASIRVAEPVALSSAPGAEDLFLRQFRVGAGEYHHQVLPIIVQFAARKRFIGFFEQGHTVLITQQVHLIDDEIEGAGVRVAVEQVVGKAGLDRERFTVYRDRFFAG